MRGFLADRRYAYREFSAPGDRNAMGGVLGIDPGSGLAAGEPQSHHAMAVQQAVREQQQMQQQQQQQQQRVVVITPRLSLPINATRSAGVPRATGAYVAGTGVARAGFGAAAAAPAPAPEAGKAAAVVELDVPAAAAPPKTAMDPGAPEFKVPGAA